MPRLFNRQPKTLAERYFADIRPLLYERHGKHYQYGVRRGVTLAEHLDSACQFVLTVSEIARVPDRERGVILAATIVHDLNKLDPDNGKLKKLARDRGFLTEQLQLAGVSNFAETEADLELVRKLIERHSGHNVSDGMRFFPEDEAIEKYAAMLTAADLFDLGISEAERLAKVQKELTVAFDRSCHLLRVKLSEDRGHLTALLLSACEEVLIKYGLVPLAVFADGELFEGEILPQQDLNVEIAQAWQKRIDRVFAGNIEQLVHATTSGIKVDTPAIEQDLEETLIQVRALLEKKKAGYKADKVDGDIKKHGGKIGTDAIAVAGSLGLIPVSNADEFAISEGIKAAYNSYAQAGLKTASSWEKIGEFLGLSAEQKQALEGLDSLYGRCLFVSKLATSDRVMEIIRDSFEMRLTSSPDVTGVSSETIATVSKLLGFPGSNNWQGSEELSIYIEANPRQRCSLGASSEQIEELISHKMPPGTKVQSFSNRLPAGMSSEPKRRGDTVASLAYQLISVGACFPNVSKQEPLYLHFALPRGASPELLRIWRELLMNLAATNAEGGTVTVDELKLYQDNILEFKANKVVGLAFPKRPEFVHSTVCIPVTWGDANASVTLLKSLHLALEMSLSLELGFPFVISPNLEVEPLVNLYGKVEGIPSSLQPLLGNGEYLRGNVEKLGKNNCEEVENILLRLRCVSKLAIAVASLSKKDDCLYDLARAAKRPFNFYHVLLRWILREQDEPNWEHFWLKIREPLSTLMENLMNDESELLTNYLKQAALIAEQAKLRGSSFKRTSQAEPFTELIKAVRSRKSHMPWEVVFASLTQDYHTRLDRIREHGVGATKYEQVKQYYQVLHEMFDRVYQSRAERLLADSKTLEAAYLFFLQEARQQLKDKPENEGDK